MTTNPQTLAAIQGFLQFYVLGDGSALGLPSVQGVRRRRPALQGAPIEFAPLDREPGASADATTELVDLSGLEDFVLLDGDEHLTLVLLWCSDYPRAELSDVVPNLPATVRRVALPGGVEAHAVALECVEKLESFLGEDFQTLELEYQIDFLPFEQLAARKAEVLAAGGVSSTP